jgi:hypothetical protein
MRVSSTLQIQQPAPRPRAWLAGLLALALLALPRPAAATEWVLVMVEQAGCIYCARWNEEVAPEYPLTPEGRFAPLRRVDLRDLPEDLDFASRPIYTPTFVLMGDGAEVGRLEGYPGEDFFWGLLGRLLSQGDAAWATQETDG